MLAAVCFIHVQAHNPPMHVAGGYEGSKVIVLLACVHVFCKHHCVVAYQFGRNGIFKCKYLSTRKSKMHVSAGHPVISWAIIFNYECCCVLPDAYICNV